MDKYHVNPEDWDNLPLVQMKWKAESLVALFTILSNTIVSHVSPHHIELMEQLKSQLLDCFDGHIERRINMV